MRSSNGNPRISALICALNEEGSLPQVLPSIPEWVDEILLVDGHSTDRTVELARELCPRARILRQPGRGKGDALKYGVSQASGDIIVTLDADGETDPQYLPLFIEPLLKGYDLAKGSRLANGSPSRMARHRRLGNKVLAFTFNTLYGTRFTDVCDGYNAFWREAFLRLAPLSDSFQMEQEMLVQASKASLKIKEVPHPSTGRMAGTSKTKAIKQGFLDWFVIVKGRFQR